MRLLRRLASGRIAAGLVALGACLLALFAGYAAQRALGAADLVERHRSASARLDAVTIGMLQVEMAHARFLAGGQPQEREQRDQALASLGAALRALDPAVLEASGHAARFHLLQQHAMHPLPSWIAASTPAALAAHGALRTSARTPPVLDSKERLFAARETQVLDRLLAERGKGERSVRAGVALLSGGLVLALCLAAAAARSQRLASGACADLARKMQMRAAELDQARAALRGAQSVAGRVRLDAHAIAARERQRISRDMHDGIGQDLYALKLELERFYLRTRRRHPRLHAGVGQVLGLADDVMVNLRAVIDDLRPDGLEQGLAAAIAGQLDKFRRRAGHDCQVDLHVAPHFDAAAVDLETASAVFRIVQEALTNIRRHAGATQVGVRLSRHPGQLRLSITDNGRGFGAGAGGKAGSFGLAGMRERVDALGGTLDIDSAPGRGTALALAIPLPAPA